MFEATRMMYFYVETPLHAGTGRSMGAVDLPIQRERVTGYPIVQSSTVKGKLRAEADARLGKDGKDKLLAIFGPETDKADEHAGALAPGDARLLLFPVRSLNGVFAWTTSAEVLARFTRDLQMIGAKTFPPTITAPASGNALVNGTDVVAGKKVVLEEYAYTPDEAQKATIQQIAQWLKENAFPRGDEYTYWRDTLPRRLVILENNAFRDFTQFCTEVQTHVKLEQKTKTVVEGALWTEESLPTDSLLYAPICATASRNSVKLSGADILGEIDKMKITRLQLGGDETTGRGMVSVRF